ncbi:MAG TPA: tripartite tricarboxylate transporter substrate-binding protein [Acetobacteraceae bacterium]|jgi:tripartite-type tricarboxylate transporter receptor subunit TctC|nr:tripartite tricarboxylate transporter substrate-binding protein [Acetobacteraceae bacterium]
MGGISRRGLGVVAAGLAAGPAMAQSGFPTRNFRVVVPTGQGGGADRLARSFDDGWSKLLGGRQFEYEFYAGAAGQVGYELFVSRRDADAYNLLFGNMGPEMIMYALQRPRFRFPEDLSYFCRIDIDDSAIFVRDGSPLQRVEDVVAEAKRRPVNVAVSRIPHPASIGMLALAEAQGARFNLIPYGGGSPTMVAVMSGEADVGALPVSGLTAQAGRLKVLALFARENIVANLTGNAPTVNAVFGTSIPDLYSSRSWAIHTRAIERFPDRFRRLEETARQVFDDPVFREALQRAGQPLETVRFGDRALCTEYAQGMIELANRFRQQLSAQR